MRPEVASADYEWDMGRVRPLVAVSYTVGSSTFSIIGGAMLAFLASTIGAGESLAVCRRGDALDCTIDLDQPSGRGRLGQSVDGYVATVVTGTVTYSPTGVFPGRLVRVSRQAPE
jgi:hypothetical protein